MAIRSFYEGRKFVGEKTIRTGRAPRSSETLRMSALGQGAARHLSTPAWIVVCQHGIGHTTTKIPTNLPALEGRTASTLTTTSLVASLAISDSISTS